MDINDSNNLDMKLENDKNEREEIDKYGKKKLDKKKHNYLIIFGSFLLFSIIFTICFITFKKNTLNKEKNINSKNEKYNNYCRTMRHLSEDNNKKDDDSSPTLMELFLCSVLADKAKELEEKDEKIKNLEAQIKELENHIEIIKQKEKLKSSRYEGETLTISASPTDSEGNIDNLLLEVVELNFFINELKQLNIEHFTYKNYVFWAYINNRALIQEGIFNKVIFSRFGFSWTRDQGFHIG